MVASGVILKVDVNNLAINNSYLQDTDCFSKVTPYKSNQLALPFKNNKKRAVFNVEDPQRGQKEQNKDQQTSKPLP